MSGFTFDEEELRKQDESMRRLARRVVRTEADAEDAAQETWVTLLQRPPARTEGLLGWLRTVTLNGARKIAGSDAARKHVQRRAARADSVPSVLADLDHKSERERAERLVDGLDEPYRQVLRMRFLEELSPHEIARRLGRSDVTVRSQLNRGLEHLRVRIGPKERRPFALFLLLRRPLGAKTARLALLIGCVAILGTVVLWRFVPAEGTRAADGSSSVTWSAAPVQEGADAPLLQGIEERSGLQRALAPTESADIVETPEAPTEADLVQIGGRVITRMPNFAAVAEIWCAPAGAPEEERLIAETNEIGRYEAFLPEGSWLVWCVGMRSAPTGGGVDPRFGSQRYTLHVSRSAAGKTLDLVLPFTRMMRGTVEAAGEPVVGARVHTTPPAHATAIGSSGELESNPYPSSCRTDARGRFELPFSDLGVLGLWIEDGGRVVWRGRVEAGDEVEIVVPAPGVLGGRVVDAEHGPLSGALVRVDFPGLPGLTATSGSDGRFRFERVPPGALELSALSGALSAAPLSMVRRLSLAEGREVELGDLVVSTGFSITGCAREHGQPLAGWRVLLKSEDRASKRATQTAADGSFAFHACGPEDHRVWLWEPAGPPRAFATGLQAGAPPLVLVPQPTGLLRCRVTGARRDGSLLELRSDSFPAPHAVAVRQDGTFELRLPPGRYELVELLVKLGERVIESFELAQDETRVLQVPPPSTGSLLVHLGFPEGRDPQTRILFTVRGPGYAVQFLPGEADGIAAVDLVNGTLLIAELLVGEYMFDASSSAHAHVHRAFRVDTGTRAELAVDFVRGQKVTVVCSAERELLPDEFLRYSLVSPDGEHPGVAKSDRLRYGQTEVVFELKREVALGEHELRIESSHGLTGSIRFSVPGPRRHALLLRSPAAKF